MNSLTDYENIELAIARAIVAFSNEHGTKLPRLRNIQIKDDMYNFEREMRVELSTLFKTYSHPVGVEDDVNNALLKISDRTSEEILEFLDCESMEELVDHCEELIDAKRDKFFKEHRVVELVTSGAVYQGWLHKEPDWAFPKTAYIELPVMRF